MNIDDAIKNATHESKCPFRTVGEQEEYKQIASWLIELKTHHAFGDYQNQAMKFAPQKYKEDFKNSMSLAGLGISGEAGEVTDYI
ncbi:MAG: hypothetical protein IJ797_02450, partial [Selenomonadaceae bacterium]|nr:hypothetical protein [Selenomonadaceae bacterium]